MSKQSSNRLKGKSRTRGRMANSNDANPARVALQAERSNPAENRPGAMRLREVRDNRIGEGVVHDVLEVKATDGSIKQMMGVKPNWDNGSGEFSPVVEIKDRGRTRKFKIQTTEITEE